MTLFLSPPLFTKLKKIGCFVKEQVDYIDAGNDWILLRFASAEDRVLVYDQRAWHVNGLNFILQKWSPCFDSYTASITKLCILNFTCLFIKVQCSTIRHVYWNSLLTWFFYQLTGFYNV